MGEEKFAEVNKVGASLYKITFTGIKATRQSFQEYLDQLEHCYMDKKPMVMLFDSSKAKVPTIYMQKKQAQWMLIHWKMIRTYCLGTAYIIESFPIRMALKLIFYFQNQPVPYGVFDNETKAIRWLNTLKKPEKVAKIK